MINSRDLELISEFVRTFPAIDNNIDSLQPNEICVCICQCQGNFTDRDRLLFNPIRPHLIQAYAILLPLLMNRVSRLEIG